MYQEDHLTASRPPNKSRCRVLVDNYGCVFFRQDHTRHLPWRIHHLWNIFGSKPPTQNCLVRGQPFFGPCSFKIAERKPPSLIFLDGGILDHAFGPPNKPNTKLLCELMFSSQTSFVLEKMPLRTPPVATLRANSCVFSWSGEKSLTTNPKTDYSVS